MKVYEGIWKYMGVYKVYPDILNKSTGREGKDYTTIHRFTHICCYTNMDLSTI